MTVIKQQWSVFLIALGFLTRIPIGKVDFSPDKLNQASRYFALVGCLIGVMCAAVLWLVNQIVDLPTAIFVSMIAGFYLTGGFHEDGLADVCDGFGGGYTTERKLSIMKDSRLGTYGTLGLVSVLGLKFLLLCQLTNPMLALILMHTLSRATATSIIYSAPYATADLNTKTKPLANNMDTLSLWVIVLSTLLVLMVLNIVYLNILQLLIIISVCLVARQLLIKWFEHHIAGYTGDCLGFAQLVIEVLGYITLIIVLGNSHV
ncbi:adenosylcobinamide-GDP ribazoletransferase [Pseudoalteromonas ulvae UL12]|uniref:adenosylcobinamide-GDP ribazoletransferase n=1 Tax=Pseudoalteromonas ulvae TaxID=107327 RepID=UPI00186B9CC4|nr:adenosylcobinamide-GDP ribazoletransferase [Pseudoalteromonas ulvae]MBE0364084.1 adenosylcobinamide-GDP ribazoletransferase [Pseudoalteromonas ulvae UL12]